MYSMSLLKATNVVSIVDSFVWPVQRQMLGIFCWYNYDAHSDDTPVWNFCIGCKTVL